MRYSFIITLFLFFCLPSPGHAYTDDELKEMEEQRIQQAMDNLASTKGEQVENAAFKFEQMCEAAVPRLVKVIHDSGSKDSTIMNAIYVLGRLGPVAKQAAPVIMPFLKNENADMRAVTAIALGKIGPASKDAVPLLDKLQYEQDPWVSKSATEALKRIRTDAALQAVEEFEATRK